ncbi:pyridoxamine 5'-phosphate oxidase [Paraglaciecola polaris]|uniref:Pyridoxine/pyridoxamine 5'-phosphate oxidase n=1 Tax=Paraglaciecola polaris LMG 21857 TaxID=1129793 RepID=K6ZBR0_9ALTE|nr:pyridoxamine 5'-phosphate oxidase [Paraglaciecola polaris]GAC33551.1 pyridoxamine 5'-phosphate oxidase [Paraglaciecola polaris LMG 21857]|tara:strand:+ start:3149 stop:3790 length:642 start_codon:yes stop_codon:yes gene_type:complete
MQPLSQIRREYSQGHLTEDSLLKDPFAQFDKWMDDAVKANLPDPTAMTVATVDNQGQPSQRIVLLKDVMDGCFVFYTNLGSRKARDLALNPKISLHFPWHILERQVVVRGRVDLLGREDVQRYFSSRPLSSQLAAWTSKQSQPVANRAALLTRFEATKAQFLEQEIPAPKFWGGYKVIPQEIEFWQGGDHRLHDRFVFSRKNAQDWAIERLMP